MKLIRNKSLYSVISALLLVLCTLSSCDGDGNSSSGSGSYILVTQMSDSIKLYVNYDLASELDNSIYPSPLTVSPFTLSHYVKNRKFVGGITLSNMTTDVTGDSLTLCAMPGHGCARIASSMSFNPTYFVADLTHPCTISFGTTLPFETERIFITNVVSVFREITDRKSVNNLKLRISSLNEKGEPTGRFVECYLAESGVALSEWTEINLSSLGACYGLQFSLNAEDVAFENLPFRPCFCLDYLVTKYSYNYSY